MNLLHREAINRAVRGVKPGTIAKELGVSYTTIWRWLRRPDVREEINRGQRALHEQRMAGIRERFELNRGGNVAADKANQWLARRTHDDMELAAAVDMAG